MRNTTKLKAILMKYSLGIDRDDDDLFKITLVDKQTHAMHQVEGPNYSAAISKAFSVLLKELKRTEQTKTSFKN